MSNTDTKDTPEFCDLILKGGITSGIIYPKLIAKLSNEYRFKNIGGTSAGAIAAACAAAAEFQRYTKDNNQGFEDLKKLPEMLSQNVNILGKPRSKLLSLFQPVKSLEKHFEILLNTLNVKLPLLAIFEVIYQLFHRFPFFDFIGLALIIFSVWLSFLGMAENALSAIFASVLLIGGLTALTVIMRLLLKGKIDKSQTLYYLMVAWIIIGTTYTLSLVNIFSVDNHQALKTIDILLKIVFSLIASLFIALFLFFKKIVDEMNKNNFGFCSGLNDNDDYKAEALTDWLTAYINKLAGLGKDSEPLTFGDLWNPSRRIDGTSKKPVDRVINLEVMTSAVSRKLPYRIPFIRDEKLYFFDPEEWKNLFPVHIVNFLLENEPKLNEGQKALHPRKTGYYLHKLPDIEKWPVIVAVRMSLSFPLLLSAVPLYAKDFALDIVQDNDHKAVPAKKVWFSDGGITSNLPLHFFDAVLPSHPTFAVNIVDNQIPPNESRACLFNRTDKGKSVFWKDPDDSENIGIFVFLKSIFETMQNWRDEYQIPYPGSWDRIVQVKLKEKEGGLNLNRPEDVIKALSRSGEDAADKLIERFKAEGWNNHCKDRLQVLLAQIDFMLNKIPIENGKFDEWLNIAHDSYKRETQKILAQDVLSSLNELSIKIQASKNILSNDSPRPHAEFRITPKV